MCGLIITNQYVGHNEYKIKRFIEEFDKHNISIDVKANDGTLIWIENNNIKSSLGHYDFIIYTDKDCYCAYLLEKAGYRLFNNARFIKVCDDKMLTFIECANKGIRMPKTYAGPLVYSQLEDNNYQFLNKIESEFNYPLVLKRVYGSLGEGVYLIENREQLISKYEEFYRQPILFQEYVKSSFGASVRVLVINKKVFGGFIRKNSSDFRSNFGQSASGEKLENPEKCFAFAQEIADKLDIEYAGLDFLFDENKNPILCEINSNAFFEEFEKITGLNVAKAIVDMIIEKTDGE